MEGNPHSCHSAHCHPPIDAQTPSPGLQSHSDNRCIRLLLRPELLSSQLCLGISQLLTGEVDAPLLSQPTHSWLMGRHVCLVAESLHSGT